MGNIDYSKLIRVIINCLEDGHYIQEQETEYCYNDIVRCFQRLGVIDETQAAGLENRSKYTKEQQRKIVDKYIEFAKTTKAPKKRKAKLTTLGVPATTMAHWVKKFYPDRRLCNMGISLIDRVNEELKTTPWQTIQELRFALETHKTNLSGVLYSSAANNKFRRRRREENGLWEYALKTG